MSERKLASVRKIKELKPIEKADRIEVAVIDGWEVVVKKGEFSEGDLCIYFEIDSWVPSEVAPFLTKEGKNPKEYNGVQGERLKTVKLRGQISQGLVLPARKGDTLGEDLTKKLNIQKWELPEKTSGGATKGSFPTDLFPKTDQERIQNCFSKISEYQTFELTLKLDGSSCSMFFLDGNLRVCSRNIELKVYKELPRYKKVVNKLFRRELFQRKFVKGNNFVDAAVKYEDLLRKFPGKVFQGELMGPGIQKNREGLKEHEFYLYDIYCISSKKYLSPIMRQTLAEGRIKHVPVLRLRQVKPTSVAQAIAMADSTPSINNPVSEGLVFKSNKNPGTSFKVISNKYLLKEQ